MRLPATKVAIIPHVVALDGLRGLAVLGVLFFHADGLLPGGYLGVDLFFVLSGYLITSILLAEHARTGRIALGAFWVRRARRLLPALLGLMPAVALYARLLAKPAELRGLRDDALATLAYVANWRAILGKNSYWDLFAAPSPLEHAWSLAIEEQFYVLWPLVVVLVLVVLRCAPRVLFFVCVALVLASAGAMLVLYDPSHTSRAYFGTDTRAGGILAGAALASVLSPSTKLEGRALRVLELAGAASLVFLGVAWARLEGQDPRLYRGGFWLTELASLVLIAGAVSAPKSVVARALSLRPLALLGAISYGVYLWHWPVFIVLTRERLHAGALFCDVVRFGVTLAVAVVSYRFLERPIRSRGIFFGPPALVVPSAFALCVVAVVWGTHPKPLLASPPPAVTSSTGWPTPFSVESRVLPPATSLPPGTARILVLGDSAARFLGLALRYRQDEARSFVAERGVGSCSVFEAEAHIVNGERIEGTCCADAWNADVAELRPDTTFIVLGGGFLGSRTCEADWRLGLKKRLLSLISAMGRDAGRVVIARVPYPMGRWRQSDVLARADCFNETLVEVAAAAHVQTLDLMGYVCPTKECILESRGAPLRPDGLHFDGVGAEDTARWTLSELRRLQDAGAP